MTKVKPILFNTEMVQALLSGRKTMTRRVVKGVKGNNHISKKATKENPGTTTHVLDAPKFNLCPYGKVGDLLYVREKFTEEACATSICYAADFPIIWPANQTEQGEEVIQEAKDYKFKPSIHMPRYFSRITLEIIDIKVERLQDISKKGAIAEGIEFFPDNSLPKRYRNYISGGFCADAVFSFHTLWHKINGKESWEANPWVWRVEFKVHKINVDEFIANVN